MHGATPITVYFDGLCPVCSREVVLYRQLDRQRGIRWHDLASAGVPEYETFGLDAALELLHVRDAQDRLHIGFDAHLVMWQRLPGFRLLAGLLRLFRPGRMLAERIYLALTRRRPGLRRRARAMAVGHG